MSASNGPYPLPNSQMASLSLSQSGNPTQSNPAFMAPPMGPPGMVYSMTNGTTESTKRVPMAQPPFINNSQPPPPSGTMPPSLEQTRQPLSSGQPPSMGQPPPSLLGSSLGQPPLSQPQLSLGQPPPTAQHPSLVKQPPKVGSGPPPPMGQPLGPPPPMGQPPSLQRPPPPMGQPLGQLPSTGQLSSSLGQPGLPPSLAQPQMGQPPLSQGQPPMGQPPIGQPLGQPPMGQPPGQPPIGQPLGQPPIGQPLGQPPIGQPSMGQVPSLGQPPIGQPPSFRQPPMGAMGQPPSLGQPPMGQPPMGQPPSSIGQPPIRNSTPLVPPPSMRHPPSSVAPPSMGQPMHPPTSMGQTPAGPGSIRQPTGPPGTMMGPIQNQPSARQRTIDPEAMPNPIAVMKEDEDKYGGKIYHTTSTVGLSPPMVTTNFSVQDTGNCSPRFMRATLYTVPCSKDLINQCRLPLGVVVQPLANIPPQENTLLCVDHGVNGPLRCNRCKAYMNCNCRFVDGGRNYVCPICQCSNEVPGDYFSHLDHTGRRTDILQRPELLYGTVEYIGTKDYCKEGRLPNPPAYIFMIDVSISMFKMGVVQLLTQTMLSILDNLPKSSDSQSPVKVGFVTYDRVLHFYNVKEGLSQPQMLVVSDTEDMFVPLVDGFLVNITEAQTVIENLMSQLVEMFIGTGRPQEVIFEPVVRAGLEALKAAQCNGRLFIFHSNLPTAPAPGQLKDRQDAKLLGTDKEKTLLSSNGVYQTLAQECVKQGVGVELYLFPTSYTDVAVLGNFANTTGGETHLYNNFHAPVDGDRLVKELKLSVGRNTGFDAVMRVRCSAGIRAVNFYGGFYMANTTDIEFGNIDADKTCAVEIKHDDKMKEDTPASIQVALLYTNFEGKRRLRVHNLSLSCSSKFSEIYHSCELETILTFFAKSIASACYTMSYKAIREAFINQCAVILATYRKNCSSQSPPAQLILPDSLKLLPMYANCLLKSDALLSPPSVTLDEKCLQLHNLFHMSISQCVAYVYPRIIQLVPTDEDGTDVPPYMRCTGQKLQDNAIYIIDNGTTMVIWIGNQVSNETLTDLFNATSHSQIDTHVHSLPALDSKLSFRVRNIISKLQKQRSNIAKLYITKQKDKTEVLFRRLLKEDKGSGAWEGINYIEFLCQVHKEIRAML